MKITNNEGLPDAIVRAVQNDPYDPGDSDITVTQLIGSPQIRVLSKRHKDEIEEDASERLWALLGQAVHTILERAETSASVEQRMYITVGGWKIGGRFDRNVIESGLLQDYKVTSAWALVFGDRLAEWERQLNVLAHILRSNGREVNRVEICAILRDWAPAQAAKSKDYPKTKFVIVPIRLWTPGEAHTYIEDRIAAHQEAESTGVMSCTNEERWYNEKKKLFARCSGYCPVRKFCDQANEPA